MRCFIKTTSAHETELLGQKIGQRLKGGETIELVSDLGGGKTTFVRGLAQGLGSKDKVASPTFTVSKVYQTNKFHMYHFDFYRLQESGLVGHELEELTGVPANIVVVEWAQVVQDVLPKNRLTVNFKVINDETRQIEFECADPVGYLLEGVC